MADDGGHCRFFVAPMAAQMILAQPGDMKMKPSMVVGSGTSAPVVPLAPVAIPPSIIGGISAMIPVPQSAPVHIPRPPQQAQHQVVPRAIGDIHSNDRIVISPHPTRPDLQVLHLHLSSLADQTHAVNLPACFHVNARLGAGSYGAVISATKTHPDTGVKEEVAIKIQYLSVHDMDHMRYAYRELAILEWARSVPRRSLLSCLEVLPLDHDTMATSAHLLVVTPRYEMSLETWCKEHASVFAKSERLWKSYPMNSKAYQDHQKDYQKAYREHEARVIPIIWKILDAVNVMHSHGLCHRDVSCSNILMNLKDEAVVLGDFGACRSIDGSKSPLPLSPWVTTIWFRAPELLYHGDYPTPIPPSADVKTDPFVYSYTTAIDMWSVGVILARMLNGGRVLTSPFITDEGRTDHRDHFHSWIPWLGNPTESDWKSLSVPAGSSFRTKMQHVDTRTLGPKWSHLLPYASPEAVDLVRRLLRWNPQERLTAEAALAQPFFASMPVPTAPRCATTSPSIEKALWPSTKEDPKVNAARFHQWMKLLWEVPLRLHPNYQAMYRDWCRANEAALSK